MYRKAAVFDRLNVMYVMNVMYMMYMMYVMYVMYVMCVMYGMCVSSGTIREIRICLCRRGGCHAEILTCFRLCKPVKVDSDCVCVFVFAFVRQHW